jgi:hypothetical protein
METLMCGLWNGRLSVNSKPDFARRYKAGEFGNGSPTWDTAQEFRRSGYRGIVHLRNRVAGGETYYNKSPEELLFIWGAVRDPAAWYCSAMAPHTEYGTWQGELVETAQGLELCWTSAKQPMRQAMAHYQGTDYGLPVVMALRRWMCPNSLEWTYELLRRYPGHVIEFSCFSRPWGTLYPKFNTVFWEVRKY